MIRRPRWLSLFDSWMAERIREANDDAVLFWLVVLVAVVFGFVIAGWYLAGEWFVGALFLFALLSLAIRRDDE